MYGIIIAISLWIESNQGIIQPKDWVFLDNDPGSVCSIRISRICVSYALAKITFTSLVCFYLSTWENP